MTNTGGARCYDTQIYITHKPTFLRILAMTLMLPLE